MQIVEAAEVHQFLRYPDFIDELEQAFAGGFTMPPRQVMALDPSSLNCHAAFAMLPAWNEEVIALKAFTYFPENVAPFVSLYSKILLFDRRHGVPLALVDGTSVTYRRTAGVSALAARFLARTDAESLLILGTGNLVPYLVAAHASVRPLRKVQIWGRSPQRVADAVADLEGQFPHLEITPAADLQRACGEVDLLVAATGSPEILVRGAWVKPGTHTDFLGNHHPNKRECDSALVAQGMVYVDTYANCFKEAGEILVPMAEGVISAEQVKGELADLCAGRVAGRESDSEITVFKSVGCALGDLCGAVTAWRGVNSRGDSIIAGRPSQQLGATGSEP
jgi:1-pyrroline-2-carboxylate reductase [NAD(P)H]